MRLSVCNHDVGPLSPFSINNEGFRKERKKESRQPKGGMGGRYTATTQGFFKEGEREGSVVLAVAHPWASASSYLSSQSLSDSRCNLHATPRSSHSRYSPSRRFFLCRSALLCLVLQRHRCLSVPCSRTFSCLSAQFRSPRCVLWPLEFIKLSSRGEAPKKCSTFLGGFSHKIIITSTIPIVTPEFSSDLERAPGPRRPIDCR